MKKEKRSESCGRYCAVIASVCLVCLLAACGDKDTVALETEEIVGAETDRTGFPDGDGLSEAGQGQEDRAQGREAAAPGTDGAQEQEIVAEGSRALLYIHICGAVREPGVYELSPDSRVYEAVEKAGGFTEEADQDYVNLSLPLEDGWKIVIPTAEETEQMASLPGTEEELSAAGITDRSGTAVDQGTAGNVTAGASARTGDGGRVNINTASAQELCTLPGIGESRAQSILDFREKNGGFSRIEDIMLIEGIKEGMFSRLKDRICVR